MYIYRLYINKLRSYDLCILYSGYMLFISRFYINELRYYDLCLIYSRKYYMRVGFILMN